VSRDVKIVPIDRVTFKLCVLAYRRLNKAVPAYLVCYFTPVSACHRLTFTSPICGVGCNGVAGFLEALVQSFGGGLHEPLKPRYAKLSAKNAGQFCNIQIVCFQLNNNLLLKLIFFSDLKKPFHLLGLEAKI